MNDEIVLVTKSITISELKSLAAKRFGDMVKGVVDLEKRIMALGADLHADEEAFLLEQRSKQQNLWGINLYVDVGFPEMVEFDSMINIRPSQNNRSRSVENETVRKQILDLVESLVIF